MALIFSRIALTAFGLSVVAFVVFALMAVVQFFQGNPEAALNSIYNVIYSVLAMVFISVLPNEMD